MSEDKKLNDKWRFWYTSFGLNFSFGPLGFPFDTVQDFWKILYLIPRPGGAMPKKAEKVPSESIGKPFTFGCKQPNCKSYGGDSKKDGIWPLDNMMNGGISLFKDGIKPIQNDEKNKVRFISEKNELMLFLLMAISGEIDEIEPNFSGVYSSVKIGHENTKRYQVELWFGDVENKNDLEMKLNKKLKNAIKYMKNC